MEFSQRTSVEATEPNVIVELGSYRWIILLIAWISFLISFVDRLEKELENVGNQGPAR